MHCAIILLRRVNEIDMKKFIICRQYLVPFSHTIAVEANSAEEACREALFDENEKHEWGDGELEWDNAFNHSIAEAVEISDQDVWDDVKSSQLEMNEILFMGSYIKNGIETDATEIIIDVDIPDDFSDKCQWDYVTNKPFVRA